MDKKRFKNKKFVVILLILGIIISIASIAIWYKDKITIQNETDLINKVVKLEEKEPDDTQLLVNPPLDENNLYWRYINTPLLE
ncbi:MAG TPA: hypothetical protein PKH06_03185, partial [Candidatus Dojkabacteria bacterium]|nr:hypothetical protein [Candidatus Dojkabacteria bacterium]